MYDGAIQDLVDQLGQLPGIGPKSAQRLTFHLLAQEQTQVQELVDALVAVKRLVKTCSVCGNVTESEICAICTDTRRDGTVICIVEAAQDVQALERTRVYRGKYHVLGGAIDPLSGIGPDQLRIRELQMRLADSQIGEIILATNPTIEGEATATYIARLLAPLEVKISRLASGLPVGGDLEYADEVTLGRALEGRRQV